MISICRRVAVHIWIAGMMAVQLRFDISISVRRVERFIAELRSGWHNDGEVRRWRLRARRGLVIVMASMLVVRGAAADVQRQRDTAGSAEEKEEAATQQCTVRDHGRLQQQSSIEAHRSASPKSVLNEQLTQHKRGIRSLSCSRRLCAVPRRTTVAIRMQIARDVIDPALRTRIRHSGDM